MGSSYAVNKWSSYYITEIHISSVDGENDAIRKRWRHQNRHDPVPDHPTVSIQNGGQTLLCGFSLDRNDFQSFDALLSAFNPAEASLRFHKKKTRYFKASDLASLGKSEDKTTLSKPALCFRFWLVCSCSWHRSEGKHQRILNQNNTQQQRIKNGANFAGRYTEKRMRRVYLSMRTEGIKAFSKRIRRCSADRQNDTKMMCGRKSFWKWNKTVPFSFENGFIVSSKTG